MNILMSAYKHIDEHFLKSRKHFSFSLCRSAIAVSKDKADPLSPTSSNVSFFFFSDGKAASEMINDLPTIFQPIHIEYLLLLVMVPKAVDRAQMGQTDNCIDA